MNKLNEELLGALARAYCVPPNTGTTMDSKLLFAMIPEIFETLDGRHGWKLVPMEPTDKMQDTAFALDHQDHSEAYRAMLAAAPDPMGDG